MLGIETMLECERRHTTYPLVLGAVGCRIEEVCAFASPRGRPMRDGLAHVLSFVFEERWVSVFANADSGVDATPFDGSFVATGGQSGVRVLDDVAHDLGDSRHFEVTWEDAIEDENEPFVSDVPYAGSKFFGCPWSQDGWGIHPEHALICQLDALDFGEASAGMSWWFNAGLFQLYLKRGRDLYSERQWFFRNVV